TAAARLPQIEALLAEQLVSKREFDEAKAAVAVLDAKIAETRNRTIEADATLAEILAEPSVSFMPSTRRGSTQRSLGRGGWAIQNAGVVQNFYRGRFGRTLP